MSVALSFYVQPKLGFEKTPELEIELQASNDLEYDYERNYLQDNFFKASSSRPTSVREYTTKTDRTSSFRVTPGDRYSSLLYSTPMKSGGESPIQRGEEQSLTKINQSIPAKRSAVQNLLVFFHFKKFYNKISKSLQQIKGFNKNHFNIIDDKSADLSSLQAFIRNFQRKTFKVTSFNQLMNSEDSPTRRQVQRSKLQDTITKYQQTLSSFLLKQIDRVPITQPESIKKITWDFILIMVRVYFLILIPLEVAFKEQLLYGSCFQFTILSIILIMMDSLLRLNTVCYIDGQAISSRGEIIKHQLKSSIIVDFFSILPLVLIGNSHSEYFNSFLLCFLMQIGYIRRFMSQIEESAHLGKIAQGIIGLVWFICTLLFILHIFSCIWYLNSINDADKMLDCWIINRKVESSPWYLQYLEAFYFATVTLMTIGYGDITPQNSKEKILAVFFIFTACIWMSYGINKIGDLIKDVQQTSEEKKRKIRVINKYMKSRKIPITLQYKIREYLAFCWAQQNDQDMGQADQILSQLPKELKEDLEGHAYGVMIDKCPLLQGILSSETRTKLLKKIKRVIIQPENYFDLFFDTNENHLCFIEEGHINLQLKTENGISQVQFQMSQGSYIGLDEFLTESQYEYLYKSINYVSLLIISKSEFIQVIQENPSQNQKYCQLKDLRILSSEAQVVYCNACESKKHALKNCPFVRFVPDRELIIKRYSYSQNQKRKQFKRSNDDSFQHSLSEIEDLKEFAQHFQDENADLIQVYVKNFLPMDDENFRADSQYGDNRTCQFDQSFDIKDSQKFPIIKVNEVTQSEIDYQAFTFDQVIENKGRTLQRSKTTGEQRDVILFHPQMRANIEENRRSLEVYCKNQIALVYQRLKGEDRCEREFSSVTLLYLQQKNQSFYAVQEFETQKNFEEYMTQMNVSVLLPEHLLIQYRRNRFKESLIFSRFVAYMNYPWDFIKKYYQNNETKHIQTPLLLPVVKKVMNLNLLRQRRKSTRKQSDHLI